MKRRPKKLWRLSRRTTKQISKGTGLSEEEVKRFTQELLEADLMRSCYDSSGGLIPDLYEIPEYYDTQSGKMIYGLVRTNSAVERALSKRRISLRTIILFPLLMVGILACFLIIVLVIFSS